MEPGRTSQKTFAQSDVTHYTREEKGQAKRPGVPFFGGVVSMNPSQLNIGVAFVAGLVSFLSPCVLPLVPIYLAQLVGQGIYQSTAEGEQHAGRLITFLH